MSGQPRATASRCCTASTSTCSSSRDPEIYGDLTLAELEVRIKRWARELDLEAIFFQTNSEGEFVEHLHRLPELADAAIVNAGAWTHYCLGDRATRSS